MQFFSDEAAMYSTPQSEKVVYTVKNYTTGGRKKYASRIPCGSPPLSTPMLALGLLLPGRAEKYTH
jgi:hypothetical protein